MKQETHLKLGLSVVVMLLVVVSVSLMLQSNGSVSGQATSQVQLSVQDARPLAKAAEVLEARYGWQVSYEDVAYANAGDILDVTSNVVKPENLHAGAEPKKVLIPKGGPILLAYDINAATRIPESPETVLKSLLDIHQKNGYPGQFSVQQAGHYFHIIPTKVKNESGILAASSSPFDVLVSFPEEERNVFDAIKLLYEEVNGNNSGAKIGLGVLPLGILDKSKVVIGANYEPARSVLRRILTTCRWKDPEIERLAPKKDLSWQMFYGPDIKKYALNIHVVMKKVDNPNGIDLRN